MDPSRLWRRAHPAFENIAHPLLTTQAQTQIYLYTQSHGRVPASIRTTEEQTHASAYAYTTHNHERRGGRDAACGHSRASLHGTPGRRSAPVHPAPAPGPAGCPPWLGCPEVASLFGLGEAGLTTTRNEAGGVVDL
jgi:hypothetical protein